MKGRVAAKRRPVSAGPRHRESGFPSAGNNGTLGILPAFNLISQGYALDVAAYGGVRPAFSGIMPFQGHRYPLRLTSFGTSPMGRGKPRSFLLPLGSPSGRAVTACGD